VVASTRCSSDAWAGVNGEVESTRYLEWKDTIAV
jgi:hypothetical protein